MASILCLFIHGGVPISIIEDDIAGTSEVETNTSRTSAADEAKHTGIVIEALDDGLSQFGLGVAIESDVVELEHVQHFFEDVQHLGHLSEDEHLLSPVLDGSEEEHHFDQLAAVV